MGEYGSRNRLMKDTVVSGRNTLLWLLELLLMLHDVYPPPLTWVKTRMKSSMRSLNPLLLLRNYC